MKQSLINVGLIKSNLKRFWPLWLAFAAAWLICLVLPMAIIAPQVTINDFGGSLFEELWIVENVGSVFGIALAAILSAALVFEYLFNQASAMFHGALPLKRGSLFLSIYLAGLLPLLAIEVVIGLLMLALSVAYQCIGMENVTCWLLLSIATTFILYSMAVLCSQFSGSRSMAAALFIAGNCLIMAFEAVIRVLSWSMLWGINMDFDMATVWTSPIGGILKYVINLSEFMPFETAGSWMALGAYCLAGLAFVIAAALLNKRRSFEVAGSTVAYKGVRIVIKYVAGAALAMAFGFVALFCVAISTDNQGLNIAQQLTVALMMVIGGFVGIYFGEAYTQKSTRVLNKIWKPGLVLAVLSIAFVVGCAMDVMGVQGYVPKTSDIKSVELACENESFIFTSEKNVEKVTQVHQEILNEGKPANANDVPITYVDITYTLKDGSTVSRSYEAVVGEKNAPTVIESQLSDLVNSKEGISSRFRYYFDGDLNGIDINIDMGGEDKEGTYVDKSANLTQEQIEEFINGPFRKDLMEHGAGNTNFQPIDYTYEGTLFMYCDKRGADGTMVYDNQNIPLTREYTPNCLKWIGENVDFTQAEG